MAWFQDLPDWARGVALVAVATALAVWVIVTILPNPLLNTLRTHAGADAQRTEILRMICHRLSTAENSHECDRVLAPRDGS